METPAGSVFRSIPLDGMRVNLAIVAPHYPLVSKTDIGGPRPPLSRSGQLHLVGVPVDDLAAFDAEVREQGGAGGTIAEDGVFHHRLTGADCGEKILEVVVAIAVALGGDEFLLSSERGLAGVGR